MAVGSNGIQRSSVAASLLIHYNLSLVKFSQCIGQYIATR